MAKQLITLCLAFGLVLVLNDVASARTPEPIDFEPILDGDDGTSPPPEVEPPGEEPPTDDGSGGDGDSGSGDDGDSGSNDGSGGEPDLETDPPASDTVVGDTNDNGVVDIDDYLCVLNGYSDWDLCPGGDIYPPCEGNGVIDLDDVLLIQQAFAGEPQYCYDLGDATDCLDPLGYYDVNEDCSLDDGDIQCVLDGFANFDACPLGDVFPPCDGNGVIDIDDVLEITAAVADQRMECLYVEDTEPLDGGGTAVGAMQDKLIGAFGDYLGGGG